MLSILNFAAYKCCDREICNPINSKARKLSESLPWVDIAIGIILCIIGGLAQYMMIPAPIAKILLDVGGAQIGVGIFMQIVRPCADCCTKGYNKARENWPEIKDRLPCS